MKLGRMSVSPEATALRNLMRQVDDMRIAAGGTLTVDAHVLKPEPDAFKLLAKPERWAERPLGYLQIEAETAVRSLRGKWKPTGTVVAEYPVIASQFDRIAGEGPIEGAKLLDAQRFSREAALTTRVALDNGDRVSPMIMLLSGGDGSLYRTWPKVVTPNGTAHLTVEQPAGVHRAVFHSLNDSIEYATNGLASSTGPFPAGSGSLHLATSASDASEARAALMATLTT